MVPRVLVLSSTVSYRGDDFLRAAAKLGVEAVLGTDRCHQLAEIWPREAFGGSLPLEFRHEAEAAAAIVHEARTRPLAAIIATDEPTADIAARAAALLGLDGNSVGAARTARNKRLMREAFARAGVPSPRFAVHEETASATAIANGLTSASHDKTTPPTAIANGLTSAGHDKTTPPTAIANGLTSAGRDETTPPTAITNGSTSAIGDQTTPPTAIANGLTSAVRDETTPPTAIANGLTSAVRDETTPPTAIANGLTSAVRDETTPPTAIANGLTFPVVVKPLLCSASRGVIRANDRQEFLSAWQRLTALLATPALRAVADPDGHRILVEEFVPGAEVALEGILRDGELTTLALFDKPDPLDGPFFEETIYVTPSRHPPELQRAIAAATADAARAIGLTTGPIHAELRLSPRDPSGAAARDATHSGALRPVLMEVAARSIGGLCARTLRFGLGQASLEELVIRHALGRELPPLDREGATGVMMIPIPAGGVLAGIHGVEAARAVPLIEDVNVTARVGEVLVPLPEGASYLGFIFARGKDPLSVENALRTAHRQLRFAITPLLQKL